MVVNTKPLELRKLAEWLGTQHETWWTIDGDHRFERRITMPASAEDLAKAMDAIGNQEEVVSVVLPAGSGQATTKIEDYFTKIENGDRQLTALGGDDNDGWLLVEQTQWVKEANEAVEAGARSR